MENFIQQAASVKPSQRQLDWFDMEMYLFCHFGVNTFTDSEWGNGNEPEEVFAPTRLDCEQWAQTAKMGGFKGIIITAKHHDGFCLWPSPYTEHSVKNSPCKVNVVRCVADACRKYGLKFGFYLSPWDRNSKYYGTPEYNDYFCNQLTELLTEYGDVFCVWFDNACGEGPNGKKQVYDFDRYIKLVRKYQPNAVIFNDYGPDTRWVGNEAGTSRTAEWSVVPVELCKYAEVQTSASPEADREKLKSIYNTDDDIGSRDVIRYSSGLTFVPSEVDTVITKTGWFWHDTSELRSVEELFDIYVASVGTNACLNLNIPPNKEGRFADSYVERVKEFREYLDKQFSCSAGVVNAVDGYTFEINVDEGKCLKYVVLAENIALGQRVESFVITDADGNTVYDGTCVGHKKICVIPSEKQSCGKYTLTVTSSRGEPLIKFVEIY